MLALWLGSNSVNSSHISQTPPPSPTPGSIWGLIAKHILLLEYQLVVVLVVVNLGDKVPLTHSLWKSP